jgi:uncharacterized membrane protein YczE
VIDGKNQKILGKIKKFFVITEFIYFFFFFLSFFSFFLSLQYLLPDYRLARIDVKIQLQCKLYIAGLLNLLLVEIFHDLFYSLRYNNKEFFNFAQNFLLFASGYLKLQIGLFERK